MARTLPLLLLVTTALTLGGCWRLPFFSSGSWSGSDGTDSYYPSRTSNLTLSNGNQAGDMGYIVAFGGDATRHEGYYDSYGANLRIDSEGSGWWTMSSIHVTGDLAGEAFAPGTRRTYTSGTYRSDDNVSVTGCSGPSFGNYTYDRSAESVTVEIEDLGGGVRRMHFETVYLLDSGARQLTVGSVDYVVPGAEGTTADRGI